MAEQSGPWEKNQIPNKERIIILIWQSSFCVLAINVRTQILISVMLRQNILIGLSQRIKRYPVLEAKNKTFFSI